MTQLGKKRPSKQITGQSNTKPSLLTHVESRLLGPEADYYFLSCRHRNSFRSFLLLKVHGDAPVARHYPVHK